jgi:solute carrier family 27 fatty acid transporter 1/4
MIGNGLRSEIWVDFTTRFNIKNIAEIYGSTEGNCNLINFDGKVGAAGFVPRIFLPLVPVVLIKVDPCSGEPKRDPETGLCIRCKFNEPGELVGVINKKRPLTDFEGYSDHNSKEKKLVRDINKQGDMAFRSGDILVMDEDGYIYFKDRIGDTFRWKGENVSTTEVEKVINKVVDLKDTIVYGVEIPNTDGRAGMVAILNTDDTLDLDLLAKEVTQQLPSYARPLFVRKIKEIDITGTFKLKKMGLQKDGFDVNTLTDPIYFYSNGRYVPLEVELYTNIVSGKIKL